MKDILRIFTRDQRIAHDATVGHRCEYVQDHQRCTQTVVEADHVQPYCKGGKTEEDNLEYLCIAHHAIKHLLDEEAYAAKLCESRMNRAQLALYWSVRKELGI